MGPGARPSLALSSPALWAPAGGREVSAAVPAPGLPGSRRWALGPEEGHGNGEVGVTGAASAEIRAGSHSGVPGRVAPCCARHRVHSPKTSGAGVVGPQEVACAAAWSPGTALAKGHAFFSLPAVRSSWSFAGVPGAQRLWMAEAQRGAGQLQEQKKGRATPTLASESAAPHGGPPLPGSDCVNRFLLGPWVVLGDGGFDASLPYPSPLSLPRSLDSRQRLRG